jgi:hypothetical protein
METKYVLFNRKAQKGDSLYEAYVMWMKEQRDFGDEAWKAKNSFEATFEGGRLFARCCKSRAC